MDDVAPQLEPKVEIVPRPWGSYVLLDQGHHFRIKRVEIVPGGQMTSHMHYHRSEHWIVVTGTVLVICDGREQLVCSGQSTYVPPCTAHRLLNPGILVAQLVEVQNGDYVQEDDIHVDDFTSYKPH